jgi:hypothetical protein
MGNAKRIMWAPTLRLIRQLGIKHYKPDHNEHTIRNTRNENVLRVYGSETLRELEKPRGGGADLRRIRWDECGAQRPTYLKYLFENVLQPMMLDHRECDAWMMGSPGPSSAGFWFDITAGSALGWKRFYWTAKDNPYIDDYEAFVAALFETNGWNDETPTYRREYLAEWANDPSRIIFRYHPKRNWLPELPTLSPGDRWVYGIACDFGVMNATACVVFAWPERFGRAVYLVESWQAPLLTTSEAAARIYSTWERYRPHSLVGDIGGMGKAYQLEWNRRYPGIPMLAANKQDKRAGLEYASDALHIATSKGPSYEHRGLFVVGKQEALEHQLATLQWDEDREDIQDGQDDDLAVCVVYGYKQSPAFLNMGELPPPLPNWTGTPWQHTGGPPRQATDIERAFQGAFRRKRT